MDTTTYEKNKLLLSRKYPKITKQLNEYTETDLRVHTITAKDNSLTMFIEKDGVPVFLHSKYKPVDEAEHWTKAFQIRGQDVIALFGFGLGYQAFEIMKSINQENIIIIYEPSIDIFVETIKHVDLQKIIECNNIILVIGSDMSVITAVIEFYSTWSSIKNTFVKFIPSYPGIFREEYCEFSKKINDVVQKMLVLKNTIIAFANDWQYNLFKNIPYVINSYTVNELYDSFKGKPIVIVSAGPSLNKNVHLLHEIEEKAVIICVDTALKVLLSEGIKPHFIVTIDGSQVNYEKFQGIKYNEIPLVYTPKCYYEILRNHTGNKVVFSSNDTYVQSLLERSGGQLGTLDTGGSVANNACSLAMKMGADPIIFIGQDLAFTNNKSHADGSMYDGKNDIGNTEQYLQIEGNEGGSVFTSRVFYVFKEWFEKTIRNDNNPRLYINATEGGAKIEGTKILAFKEAIHQYCCIDINTNELIRSLFRSKRTDSSQNARDIIQIFNESLKELDQVIAKCNQGSDLSLKLFNIYNKNKFAEVDSILKKLNQIDKDIKKKRDKFLLIHYIIQPLLFILNDYLLKTDFESQNDKGMHIAKTSKILYDGMKEAIEFVKPWIKECIIELEELSRNLKEDSHGLEI